MVTFEYLIQKCTIDNNDCWNWNGTKNTKKYGQLMINRKRHMAHRISWSLKNGEIPTGMVICHKCDNTSCINPDHLFLGTQKDNIQDASRKGRMHKSTNLYCKNGHLYNEKNTYYCHDNKHKRCRVCAKESRIKYKNKQALLKETK
jgi:hypothetical protein